MRALPLLAVLLAAAPTIASAQPDPREMLAKADRNDDGVVERAEAASMRGEMFDRLDRRDRGYLVISAAPRKMKARGEQMRALLVAADADRNGKVTRQEFQSAPMPAFDRADANRDGRIDSKELAALKAR
ncbi:EF-hand domain-containing protein [Caulobacter sp. NIBR2454]|uniref:EF-hand domain-containing protein n=1 Tax=Caulobacter sp. NIBR2454 TaxID=3015996 RepID=UPI0022B653D7|nr:EF-hand domain-containing protein [Caulobacter sp. NIBR2454]